MYHPLGKVGDSEIVVSLRLIGKLGKVVTGGHGDDGNSGK